MLNLAMIMPMSPILYYIGYDVALCCVRRKKGTVPFCSLNSRIASRQLLFVDKQPIVLLISSGIRAALSLASRDVMCCVCVCVINRHLFRLQQEVLTEQWCVIILTRANCQLASQGTMGITRFITGLRGGDHKSSDYHMTMMVTLFNFMS